MALPRNGGVRRPLADVSVYGVQRRSGDRIKRPWIVRWSVEGRQRSKSFRTRAESERYRAALIVAQQSGEAFDVATGEPVGWLLVEGDTPVHRWARRWLAEQWPEWQPRTRSSAVEALARFVPLVVPAVAPAPPASVRAHLVATLVPGADVDREAEAERWLERWGLQLGQLDRSSLSLVEQRLATGDGGAPLAASTAARFRKIARACIRRAVELEVLAVDPWPPAPGGRSRRKAARLRRPVDIRRLPDPATMAHAIEAVASHQPASRAYQVMTAVGYYAGLRPSEVVMLRPRALELPTEGWGRVHVVEADVSFDEPGEPKTGPRTVPIPPVLVERLRAWIEERQLGSDDLLFRTRTGRRPAASNWGRAWQRALAQVGHPPLRVYDTRHAAATTWLAAGVPLGEVARRLGHSVETLVSTYVGALSGDEALSNERIDAVLSRR